MNCDVLLINPLGSKYEDADEHLGLGYIASYARAHNISVAIIDVPLNSWTLKQAVSEISKYSSKLIGISIPFQQYAKEALELIGELRSAGFTCHITAGGIFPTFAYEELFALCPQIDSIILGEGEITFYELAKKILEKEEWRDVHGLSYVENGEVIKTPLRPLTENIDDFPYPARDSLPLVLKRQPSVSMLSSRGCYGGCSFCSVVPFFSSFGPRCRVRSTENIIDEMQMLINTYGVHNIIFNDAEFAGGIAINRAQTIEIAQEIIKRNFNIHFSIQCRVNDIDIDTFEILKQAGLRRVFLGVESGSQAVLDRFKKGVTVQDNIGAIEILSKLDVYVSMGFIMFDEQTTFEEVSENMDFIKQVKSLMPKGKLQDVFIATKALPLAGSEVERKLKQSGRYEGNCLDFNYKLNDPNMEKLFNSMIKVSKATQRTGGLLKHKNNWDTNWMILD